MGKEVKEKGTKECCAMRCKADCMDEHSAKEDIIEQLLEKNTVKTIIKAGKECHEKCPDAKAGESQESAGDGESQESGGDGESQESCMGTCMNNTRASIIASNPVLQEIMKAG